MEGRTGVNGWMNRWRERGGLAGTMGGGAERGKGQIERGRDG